MQWPRDVGEDAEKGFPCTLLENSNRDIIKIKHDDILVLSWKIQIDRNIIKSKHRAFLEN